MWQSAIAYLTLVFAPLFWSGNFLVGRVISADIGPFTMAFFRWLFVIGILTPFMVRSVITYRQTIKDHFSILCVLGLLCVTMYTSFIYWGLHNTTVVNAALLDATVPIWTLILAYIFFNEPLTQARLAGIFVSFMGASLLITQGQLSMLLDFPLREGDALILVAAICWALYSILLKKVSNVLPPLLFLYISAILGTCFLLPAFAIETFMNNLVAIHWSSVTISALLYAAIFASITAFTFWNIGVMNVGATTASYFFNLMPMFSSLLAVLALGEHFQLHHMFGILLVLSGAYLATANINKLSIKSFSRKMTTNLYDRNENWY